MIDMDTVDNTRIRVREIREQLLMQQAVLFHSKTDIPICNLTHLNEAIKSIHIAVQDLEDVMDNFHDGLWDDASSILTGILLDLKRKKSKKSESDE